MAEQLGAEPDRWQIVLVVVERDGSVVLDVEPTRTAVACPVCGTLSRRQHSSYQRWSSTLCGVLCCFGSVKLLAWLSLAD